MRLRQFAINCFATLLLASSFVSTSVSQEIASDTLGYENQRQKVNTLLTERSARFGQFDESLQKRTGIFGLKTKKDMQASIDILKQIVLMDNAIFKETKALLDYKDFEKTQVVQRASEFDGRINGYIKTISKLQRERERVDSEMEALEKVNQLYKGVVILFGLALIGVVAFFALKRQKLTNA